MFPGWILYLETVFMISLLAGMVRSVLLLKLFDNEYRALVVSFGMCRVLLMHRVLMCC